MLPRRLVRRSFNEDGSSCEDWTVHGWRVREIMIMQKVKLVIFVPISHADIVRKILGESGAGRIGNYDFCSFSSRGVGRFRGNEHADPAVGTAGLYEAVEEERIEVIVPRELLKTVIERVKKVHPYEEVAFDIYRLETI